MIKSRNSKRSSPSGCASLAEQPLPHHRHRLYEEGGLARRPLPSRSSPSSSSWPLELHLQQPPPQRLGKGELPPEPLALGESKRIYLKKHMFSKFVYLLRSFLTMGLGLWGWGGRSQCIRVLKSSYVTTITNGCTPFHGQLCLRYLGSSASIVLVLCWFISYLSAVCLRERRE